ncbi:MAG: hypothetical protein PHI97_15905 [Desulfobulbus sp.]|nr:hypothetical protein [Desulfobulbus sp.]
MQNELEKQRKSIATAMEYAVPEEFRAEAEDLVEIYHDDRIGLTLLLEFYSYLPEAREEWIRELRLINRQQGIFLLAARTDHHRYLYLVSSEGIEFQGDLDDGYLNQEVIDYFGYENTEAFVTACSPFDELPIYEPLQVDAEICPACHTASGENHELGCPVELCPWCGGQLIHCDCRFEKLGLDAFSSEAELAEFEALLEERGRIPYSPEQRPVFADEGPGVLFD